MTSKRYTGTMAQFSAQARYAVRYARATFQAAADVDAPVVQDEIIFADEAQRGRFEARLAELLAASDAQ